ncbi:MAG: fumarate hydratase, partial [Elusimicrobiota bacterium]
VELSCLALTEINFNPEGKEKILLDEINSIKKVKGRTIKRNNICLGVKIKYFPQHIAGLAVGVHIGCWCNRVRRFKIE